MRPDGVVSTSSNVGSGFGPGKVLSSEIGMNASIVRDRFDSAAASFT